MSQGSPEGWQPYLKKGESQVIGKVLAEGYGPTKSDVLNYFKSVCLKKEKKGPYTRKIVILEVSE